MADIAAIREGLAALLRAALPEDEGHVGPYFLETPPVPSLTVAAVESMVGMDFGDGQDVRLLVEAYVGTISDIGAQKRLDALVGSGAVPAAVESDSTGAGALFSRLNEKGELLTGQSAAAHDVSCVSYRGQQRIPGAGGTDRLVGTWEIQVIT